MTVPTVEHSLTALQIVRDGDTIEVSARVPSVVLPLTIAGVLVALMAIPLVSLWSTALREFNRPQGSPIDLIVVLIYVALLVTVLVIVGLTMARRRKRRGVTIKDGIVTVYTPDTPTSQHVFGRVDLKGVELRGTPRGACVIHRHVGASIVTMNGLPAVELAQAALTLNAMVMDTRHKGFDVLASMTRAPLPTNMPPLLPGVLSPQAPLRVETLSAEERLAAESVADTAAIRTQS